MMAFLAQHFTHLQIGIGVLVVVLFLLRWLKEDSASQFKVREADRGLKFERGEKARASGDAAREKPRLLTGARVEGQPHEILGVPALASESEIQKAYKDLMKRYHPDRVGRPGSREWHDAQAIAEALNRARGEMLEKLRRRPG